MKRLIFILFTLWTFSGFTQNPLHMAIASSASGERTYIDIINDGNTVAWYLADDITTITKNESNLVTAWNDKLGSGHNLIGGADYPPAYCPIWSSTGITFDGAQNYMETAGFTLNQPEFVYMVVKVFSTSPEYGVIFNGIGGGIGLIYLYDISESGARVKAQAQFEMVSAGISTNSFIIIRALYNGVSSKVIINGGTPVIGNVGTGNMGGFALGSRSQDDGPSYVQVKEIILRDVSDSSGDETLIYNYLKAKYGL